MAECGERTLWASYKGTNLIHGGTTLMIYLLTKGLQTLLYWILGFNIWILERDTNIQSKPNVYAYFQNKDDDKRKEEEERGLEDENNKERKKTLR